jgi:hypothetical protein
MICSICGGSGYQGVVVTQPVFHIKIMRSQPCLCLTSKLVSEECPSLLGDCHEEYMPLERIDKQLVFDPTNLLENQNYMVRGNDWLFRQNVKSIMMRHRFDDPVTSILFCSSISVLRDFYVEQKDGSSASLADTNKFHLMVICLDTMEKNDQLKTCIAEVVYIRMRSRRPTWLYLPTFRKVLSDCTYEYSEELMNCVKASYQIIEIVGDGNKSSKRSASQDSAAGFVTK